MRVHAAITATLLLVSLTAGAEDPRVAGSWVLNLDASDDVDKAIEKVVSKDGGKMRPPPGTSRRARGRYRGGPEDEALYDRVTYDKQVSIGFDGSDFTFTYADGFVRRFSTNRTTRSQSASGTGADDDRDFSFAYWDGPTLYVESRPRDQGWIMETYRLREPTGQLELALQLNPSRFGSSIEVELVFDRAR
jgi:hypothetical protein